ncbi:hypothetical protein HYV86_05445 [Candidatus Woesearchaeota archaeon]|nr:hypothetical protein [Candidatus Woesearchaeota archaeon]
MDISILKKVGFTDGEIKIYLALLELGETTTGPIIDKAHISSSKVYEILEKLTQKGLVSHVQKSGMKYFQPSSPQRLLDYIQQEKRAFEESEKELEKIIPLLEQRQKLSQEAQTCSVYEGFEGIKTVFNRILETLKKGEEYYVFTVDEEITSPELKLFFLNYHLKRIEKGIRVKLLSKIIHKNKITKLYPQYKLSQRRFIDHAFPTGVFIFKGYVMHFIYSPTPTLFVIQSEQTYSNYERFFEEMWNKAKP